MGELRRVYDCHRCIRSVDTCIARTLIEQLGKGLQCIEDADAGHGRDRNMPIDRYAQSVRFIDSSSKWLMHVNRIGGILLDGDAVYVCLRSGGAGLEIGIPKMELPRCELIGENPILGSMYGSFHEGRGARDIVASFAGIT